MSINSFSYKAKKHHIRLISIVIISLLYAYFLSSLPNEYFRDRTSYIRYALYSHEILQQYDGYTYLVNEPLFLLFNFIFSGISNFELVPKIYVFFISFTIFYLIVRNSNNIVSGLLACLLLFFIPFTFHLQLVVLRQGIATALLLWSTHFFWENKKVFYTICFLLSFFHISFIIIFLILITDYILSLYIKNIKIKLLANSLILFVSSSVMLGLAKSLGVRQAQSDHLLQNNNGFGGFVLFLFLFIFLYFRGLNNTYNDRYGRISLIGILAYLSFYYTIPVSGRLISSILPFALIYLASSNNLKIIFSFFILLLVSFIIFVSSISGGSLTFEGVSYLNSLF